MSTINDLEHVKKLILDRAGPAEIVEHLVTIQEQFEAQASDLQNTPDYKAKIAALEAEKEKLVADNKKLVAENQALESKLADKNTKPSFSTTGRKREFGRDQQQGI